MAARIVLGEFSIAVSTWPRRGGLGGFLNSVMSARAMKVRPPQVSTIAFTSGSAIALFMHSRIPPRTAALSAFTGGLLIVIQPMKPSRASFTFYLTHFFQQLLFPSLRRHLVVLTAFASSDRHCRRAGTRS